MQLKTDLCEKRELFFLKSTFLNKRELEIKGKLHLEVKEQEQMSFSCVLLIYKHSVRLPHLCRVI